MKKYLILGVLVLVVAGVSGYLLITQKKPVADETMAPPQKVNLNRDSISASGSAANPAADDTPLVAHDEIPLTITSPKDQSTATDPSLRVSGTTAPNADVFVNDVETKSDAKGNFNATIDLEEADNYIVVVVTDADGKTAEAEMNVTYQAE